MNQPTQLVGYTVKAGLSGSVVTLDWFNDELNGWVNVYVGTLQSGVASTAVPDKLETPDTALFDYLKPNGNSSGDSSDSSDSSSL